MRSPQRKYPACKKENNPQTSQTSQHMLQYHVNNGIKHSYLNVDFCNCLVPERWLLASYRILCQTLISGYICKGCSFPTPVQITRPSREALMIMSMAECVMKAEFLHVCPFPPSPFHGSFWCESSLNTDTRLTPMSSFRVVSADAHSLAPGPY